MEEVTSERMESGTISVQMENIFPIIKKWLYSEKDIFLRELVTNSIDAINKLKHLSVIGEFKGLSENEEYSIDVNVDKDAGTITVRDNGIGMAKDEIKNYINEVAFSSAQSFIDKYKTDNENNQIIGHFGLGFYSSFMVAKLVEIKSKSYNENYQATHWSCDGTPKYQIEEVDKEKRGTDVILHISDDEKEFLEIPRVRHILKTYCDFLPVPIKLNGELINKKKPLWLEKPADIKEEDYRDFYKYLYPFEEEPLFWVHLNVEFPVRAKGILYFPKLKHELDPNKGKIKFYYNQVYVSDNLKDLIPEFLTNLQGVIDCPDMPLNVSRSYLQSDPTMKKLSNHITKKVSDELNDLYKSDREQYIKYWEEIHPFIKFGMMSNEKFYEQVKDIVLFKSTLNRHISISEYNESNKEKTSGKIYYASDEVAQSFYLNLFKNQGIEVLIMNSMIDSHFIQFLEMRNHELKFVRIDSDVSENLVEKESASKIIDPKTNKTMNETLLDIFQKNLNIPKLTIKIENFKTEDIPAMIVINEQQRRFREMSILIQKKQADLLDDHTLVINANNPTIKNIKKMHDMIKPPVEDIKLICDEIYDLALLTQKNMSIERVEKFIENSHRILNQMSDKLLG